MGILDAPGYTRAQVDAAIVAGRRPTALPTHVPDTSTGNYQLDKAVYNAKPSNLRRLRAGLGRAGRADNGATVPAVFNELWLGDSIVGGCTGLSAGPGGTDRFNRTNTIAHFTSRDWAARFDVPVAGSGLWRPRDATRLDARTSLNAAATTANSGSGGSLALTSTSVATLTSGFAGDAFRFTYYDNFSSSTTGFIVSVNGATSGQPGYRAVTGTSTNLWKSILLTGLTITPTTTITLTGNAGTTYVGLVETLNRTQGGVVGHNGSNSGSSLASYAAVNAGGFSAHRQLKDAGVLPFEYDVVHCAFGLFDAVASPTDPGPFRAGLVTVRNMFPNSDFVIHAMPTPGQYRDSPAVWQQFVTASFQAADELDVPVVDVQGLLGGYYAQAALGMTGDTTAHLLEGSYKTWAEATTGLAA